MKIIAYPISSNVFPIKPANQKRNWMDTSNQKYAYRCLPLTIANSYGWEILSPARFVATWNGGANPSDVAIKLLEGSQIASSLFGEGTFTWHTGYVFKTEYPYALYVTGAPNYPKKNIIPLSGIVETFWLPFSFTMNWRFTQPGEVIVEKDEPICQIFPVDITLFDYIEPEIRTLEEDKEFYTDYWNWHYERDNFIKRKSHGLNPNQSWQKNYFQGNYPPDCVRKCPFHITDNGKQQSIHKTKINVPEFHNKQTLPFKFPTYVTEKYNKLQEYLSQIKAKKGK